MTTALAPVKKRPAVNVMNAMAAGPWAILPSKLDLMIKLAMREALPAEAIEAYMGEPLEHTYSATTRDGIATLCIEGPIFKRADWFSRMSGATSYTDLALDLHIALDDPAVRAIILNIDSEGGQVAGCSEFARMIHAARGRKPIIAYVEGMAASAAFWIAAACDEIVASDTALLGSLGCVLCLEITTKQDEMMGIEHVEIVSAQTPKKRMDPQSAAGKAQLQQIAYDIADVFLSGVAEFRDIDPDIIAEQYGEGGLFVGERARATGLADRLGSYESLMTELSSPALATSGESVLLFPAATTTTVDSGRPTPPATGSANMVARAAGQRGVKPPVATSPTPGASAGAGTEDPPAGSGADAGNEEETGAGDPPPANTPPATPPATPAADPVARAVAAERARVLAIQKLGRAGEEAIVAACIEDAACTPEVAAFRLRSAEATGGSQYLAALACDESRVPAPSVTADAAAQRTEIDAAEDLIVNAGKRPATTSAKR